MSSSESASIALAIVVISVDSKCDIWSTTGVSFLKEADSSSEAIASLH